MLGKLKNLSKLKQLLTRENLGYLDITLAILTSKEFDPAYSAFWRQFATKFPHPEAGKRALLGLIELHKYVRQELNG
jgi:hypothetical protein